MSDDKFEAAELKKKDLLDSLEKAKSQASNIVSFTLSYEDLANHFNSIEADLVKRAHELEANEKDLKERSQELELKAQHLEQRGREIESADELERKVEEMKKQLESLNEKVQSEESKLLSVENLLREKKIELEKMKEEVEALQKRKNEVGEGYKNISENDQRVLENKYTETQKKINSEEKKLRDCTVELELKRGDLDRANVQLSNRQAETDMEERILNNLRQNIKDAEKKRQDLERPNERNTRAPEAKQRGVDLSKKSLGRGSGNRDISGDEGRYLGEMRRGTEGSNLTEKSLREGRGNRGFGETEGSNSGEKSLGKGRGNREVNVNERSGYRHRTGSGKSGFSGNDGGSSKKPKL